MSDPVRTLLGGPIFDGTSLHEGHALRLVGTRLDALGPEADIGRDGEIIDLDGDILGPGYVDLQVNGGDGLLFNDAPTADTLGRMAKAHARLGATTILPTLITDTPDQTRAAIDAATEAVAQKMPGIGGLHLEGPHLSQVRKGAHDPALIRPMQSDDLDMLLGAARDLPCLMLTIAPESVSLEQAAALAQAGAIVSLGHTDADAQTCAAYQRAGVSCVTHLFNAMSQLGSRAPGLVGTALANGALSAGLIADGIHVHPDSIRVAFAAKQAPGALFLVSDAMAPAGTDMAEFQLNNRTISRHDGRLTLEDGTLAGADLDLTTAIRVMHHDVGLPLEMAMAMATSIPAQVARLEHHAGHLRTGSETRLIRIAGDLSGQVAELCLAAA